MLRPFRLAPAVLLALLVGGCPLPIEVISVHPHDELAYTQGLLLVEGMLYESTGLYGRSSLREVDPQTGEVIRQVALPSSYFGEGLARVNDRLIQLTYHAETAFVYDLETFEVVDSYEYEGEGWGLCHDGVELVMSNGSATLTFRDPETFEALHTVNVRNNGVPVPFLNELECVGESVYANIYRSDRIVKIEKGSGRVSAVFDASGLLTPEEQADADVLNGIAYVPQSGTFLITGKLWPKLFEVGLAVLEVG